jgi:CheY-like chemotaxis protein/anti-sigma regulatory factor (Ser/Thr protein kinase)
MTDLALLVHDLRTPILSILGFNAIAENDDDASQRSPARARIDMLGDHLLNLVNDILLTARAEQTQIVLDHVAVSAPRLLADVISVVQPAADAKQIKLGLSMAKELPLEFMGDPVRLRQILINLVSNAVTYSPPGTKVEIEAGLRSPVPELFFCVHDQGPGMTAQEAQAVFRPFQQIPRISGTKGTGLGLTICDRLVRAMGGTIKVVSSPGTGSSFAVTLPIAARLADEDHEGATIEHPAKTTNQKFDILVVDDNELSNELVSHIAARGGHTVASVHSGPAALEYLAQNAVDLVLLDQRMTGMDGLETARRIRAMQLATSALKIVGLTAHLTPDLLERARQAGLDDCFQRTIRPTELIAKIDAILSKP